MSKSGIIGLGLFVFAVLCCFSCAEKQQSIDKQFSNHAHELWKRTLLHFKADSCYCGLNLFYEKFPHNNLRKNIW